MSGFFQRLVKAAQGREPRRVHTMARTMGMQHRDLVPEDRIAWSGTPAAAQEEAQQSRHARIGQGAPASSGSEGDRAQQRVYERSTVPLTQESTPAVPVNLAAAPDRGSVAGIGAEASGALTFPPPIVAAHRDNLVWSRRATERDEHESRDSVSFAPLPSVPTARAAPSDETAAFRNTAAREVTLHSTAVFRSAGPSEFGSPSAAARNARPSFALEGPAEVHVHIGRIEVTALHQLPGKRRGEKTVDPTTSLAEYLAKREKRRP